MAQREVEVGVDGIEIQITEFKVNLDLRVAPAKTHHVLREHGMAQQHRGGDPQPAAHTPRQQPDLVMGLAQAVAVLARHLRKDPSRVRQAQGPGCVFDQRLPQLLLKTPEDLG